MTECEECGAPVTRVFHPIAVHFKGSGFYNTDYGTAKRKREMDKSATDGAEKHDAKQAEKKSDSKPASIVLAGLVEAHVRLISGADSRSRRTVIGAGRRALSHWVRMSPRHDRTPRHARPPSGAARTC